MVVMSNKGYISVKDMGASLGKPVLLFRASCEFEGEFDAACRYFDTYRFRSEPPAYSTVIGRYSVLPFYSELEVDLCNVDNSKLINSYAQHRWISNFDYYETMEDITPRTWRDGEMPRCEYDGPFVVKGATNSRKFRWDTHMFARDKRRAIEIGAELSCDDLIGPQGLIYRKYIPLKTFEVGINGLPFTNEWRFFFLGKKLIAHGYYWSTAEKPELATMDERGLALAQKVANRASKHVNFFAVDIAEKADGSGWILIELNDGQMAGLSEIDPYVFYKNLGEACGITY